MRHEKKRGRGKICLSDRRQYTVKIGIILLPCGNGAGQEDRCQFNYPSMVTSSFFLIIVRHHVLPALDEAIDDKTDGGQDNADAEDQQDVVREW